MKTLSGLILASLLVFLQGCGGSADIVEQPLLALGTLAPEFTAFRVDGAPVKLSDYKGKVVLVDFWATWCGPCKASMPHMENFYTKLKSQGLEVLGVCVWDEKSAFEDWDKKPDVPTSYLKVFDPAGRGKESIASNLYSVSGIPTFYLVGKDGKIAYAGVGSGESTEKELEKALGAAGFKL